MNVRRGALALAVVTVAALGIAWLRTPDSPHDEASDARPRSSSAVPPEPRSNQTQPTSRAPLPTSSGEAHDEAGAVRAAVGFTELVEEVVRMSEADALAVQDAIASTRSRDALRDDLRRRLAELREVYPDGVVYRVAPMAATATVGSPDEIEVSVWYAAVLTAPGLPPMADWRTSTFALVWERRRWRIAEEVDLPGPQPATVSARVSTEADLRAAMGGSPVR